MTAAMTGMRCKACGVVRWPDVNPCPQCHEDAAVDIALSGRGAVVAATVSRRTRPDVLVEMPFQVLLVQMDEGPLGVFSSTEEAGFAAQERVEIEPLDGVVAPDGEPVLTAKRITNQ